ncbi:E3 ubiquitin ligase, partial [Coemansia helicoidea]
MVVQHAELAMADKRFAQIAEALQCSICLDTFGHPHSLACGHTFCQECLLQWLAQSKQCPTCRAPVRQRPAVAFAVCDVIRCVHPPGGGGEQLPGASQADDDPWASLFPARTAVSAAGIAAGRATLSNFVVCSVCSRNMLEGETCINCAIDALHRSITTRLGSTAAAPLRQPRPIQLSHVTRRRNEILASADRLLASTRRFESAIASSATHTAPDQPPRPDNPYSARFASLLDTSAQLQDIQLRNARLARRLALLPGRVPPPLSQSPSPSSSPSPPDSLFDPTDL